MTIHTTCPGCGADLTQESAVSIDFLDAEWCYFTIRLDADGHPVLPIETRQRLPDDNLSNLSCANCGDWLMEV